MAGDIPNASECQSLSVGDFARDNLADVPLNEGLLRAAGGLDRRGQDISVAAPKLQPASNPRAILTHGRDLNRPQSQSCMFPTPITGLDITNPHALVIAQVILGKPGAEDTMASALMMYRDGVHPQILAAIGL